MNTRFVPLFACLALTSLAAAQSVQAQTKLNAQGAAADTSIHRLDLKLGDIRNLFTPEQLRVAMNLDSTGQPNVVTPEELDTVVVKGEGAATRSAPMGFAAMLWGIRHPTQTWRLFMPIAAGETFDE